MKTSLIIPWRAGDEARNAALTYVRRRYTEDLPDYELIVGEQRDGLWRKAAAIQDGLRRTDADVLVLADADVWCDGLERAVTRVVAGVASWAVPHAKVIRLDEASTRTLLDGGPLKTQQLARHRYLGIIGGGLIVIRRDLYDRAPLDRRFTGWGHEDQSAGIMWRCLAGEPWRGSADLVHLWHPPQPKLTEAVGSRESYELHLRYRKAATDPELMLDLITEGLVSVT